MTLPPLIGERGAEAVSAVTTDTSAAVRPRPSATSVANPVVDPDMSTTPVTRLIRPSASRRQIADAGCRAAGPRADGEPHALAGRE